MAASAGTAWIEVKPDMDSFGRELERGVEKSASGFGGMLQKASMAGVVAAGAAIGGALFVGINAAMDQQTNQIKFETLFGGNTEKAKGFIADLTAFAAKTPFDLPGLSDAATKLLGVGTAAEDVIPMMTTIGNSTALMGTGAEGINRATTALAQMQMTGKVTAEDMNQLRDAGVNAWGALAESMGKSIPEVQKMVSDGLVPADEMFKAIEDDSLKAWETSKGGMDKLSQTAAGQLSSLKDNVTQTLGNIFSVLIPPLTAVLDFVNNKLFPGLSAGWKIIKPHVDAFIGVLQDTLLPIFEAIVSYVTEDLIPVLTGIWETWWPIIQEVATIIWEWLYPPLKTIGDFIVNTVWPAVLDLAKAFSDHLGPALETVSGFFETIVGWLIEHKDTVKVVAEIILLVFTPALVAMGIQATIQFAKVVAGFIASAAQAVVSTAKIVVQFAIQLAWTAIMGAAYVWMFAVMAAQWIKAAAVATINAAKIVAAWVVQKAQMLITVGLAVINFAILIAQWVALGIAALINAAIVAAAWIIAFWPVALIVAAIIAVIAIVWIFWDEIKAALGKVWEFIQDVFTKIWDFVVNIWNTLFETVKAVIQAWWDFIVAIYTAIWDFIVAVFTGVKDAVLTIWNALWDTVKAVVDTVWNVIKSTFNTIKDTITTIFNTIKDTITTIWDTISTTISTVVENIKGFVTGLWDKIKEVVNLGIGALNTLIRGANAVTGILPGDFLQIPEIPELAKGGIVNRATLAIIGESGPEAVVPLSGSSMPFGGAGAQETPIYLTIKIGDQDITDMIEEITRKDQDHLARMLVGGRRL